MSSCVVLVLAGGCSGEDIGAGPGGVSGSGPTAGTTPGLSGASTSGATSTSGGASSTSGSGAGAASPGGALSTGGSGLGGDVTGSGGAIVAAGGTGGGSKLCVDLAPPPDPNWPDATCQRWAAETKECAAAWFSQYCDVSCGRCVPAGGGTGGSGTVSGGTGSGGKSAGGSTAAGAASGGKSAGGSTAAGGTASGGKSAGGGGGNAVAGAAGSGTAGAASVNCASAGLPNVTGGEGFATRYWDCCQPHCSQFNGHRCGQDGVTGAGNQTSACNGGGSFACYDEAPRAVSDCLSYGHIAKANPNCGGCYRIQFTGQGQHNASDPGSVLIKGKQMIVKVTNTGGDVAGSQFDLMIPGGGVGLFNACSRQWGTSDLGAQYGGFLTECTGSHSEKKECVRRECMKVPAGPARNGCLWFVDWLQVADNPKFTSQATSCPF